jgi:trans-aconitate methyltransferase
MENSTALSTVDITPQSSILHFGCDIGTTLRKIHSETPFADAVRVDSSVNKVKNAASHVTPFRSHYYAMPCSTDTSANGIEKKACLYI